MVQEYLLYSSEGRGAWNQREGERRERKIKRSKKEERKEWREIEKKEMKYCA